MMTSFERNLLHALAAEGRPEAMVNAIKFADSKNYEDVFTAVMEMENKNYIKLVYCQFPTVINVQLTLVGKEAYETQSRI